MRHTTGSVYAVFDKPVRMYRGTTMAGIIRDEARTNDAGLRRRLRTGDAFARPALHGRFLDPGAWGREFTTAIDAYANMAGMWIVGEDMPQETNRVTLATRRTSGACPSPTCISTTTPTTSRCATTPRAGQGALRGGRRDRTFPTPPYPSTHNLGTNRMSAARDGVVNSHGQTHDIKNLFIWTAASSRPAARKTRP